MKLLIQGSYAPGLGASFGTHDGGGAVDIWVVDPDDRSLLLDDIPQMVTALRQSGFAAWFRPEDMLYDGMYAHIHAIAIGDADLSEDARAQLDGSYGYFAGQNGLPQPEFNGPDPHGGALVCPWMTQSVASPTPLALACQRPIEDYTRMTIEGHTINRRTYLMLQTAQALYGGPGNLLWITQGSYSTGVAASFGTHDGGGAVDISIRHRESRDFLY
ncbi:MAG: hypothetical protein ACRDIB_05100, partial [Ardenticatenaceae bacterium]